MTDIQETAAAAGAEEESAALDAFYAELGQHGLMPLWTQRDDLMPTRPEPSARPAMWRWADLYPLAQRAGELVPVGRGGERRAIALANPGIPGQPYTTPTLWCAIQFLGPREAAPAHRHTQTAFRFVIEGSGVWTNVDGDAVAMRRGDLLLTPGWHFHEHHNTTDHPMAWIDGLDIPLVSRLDAGFFEFGPDELGTTETPERSRNERLWGHAGLSPVAAMGDRPDSPLMAYRWENTDAALTEQLALESEGVSATVEPGHAAVRYTNPANGRDALQRIRTEMHRYRGGASSGPVRTVGSSVWQVFAGSATVTVGDQRLDAGTGDLFAVPSWVPLTIDAREDFDAFRFGDDPVYEALGLARRSNEGDAR